MAETLTVELHNRASADRVREALAYDAHSGLFAWKISAGRVRAGTPAGVLKPHGYIVIQIDRQSVGAHRLAWLWMTGTWPDGQIDHIDGARANNRFANLRDVSWAWNQQNQRRPQSHNRTSRYLGVSWHSRSRKWRASITIGGRTIEIGKFESEDQASRAYIERKRLVHAGSVL